MGWCLFQLFESGDDVDLDSGALCAAGGLVQAVIPWLAVENGWNQVGYCRRWGFLSQPLFITDLSFLFLPPAMIFQS